MDDRADDEGFGEDGCAWARFGKDEVRFTFKQTRLLGDHKKVVIDGAAFQYVDGWLWRWPADRDLKVGRSLEVHVDDDTYTKFCTLSLGFRPNGAGESDLLAEAISLKYADNLRELSVQEFLSWLDGYSASLPESGVPTREQWLTIKDHIRRLKRPGRKPNAE